MDRRWTGGAVLLALASLPFLLPHVIEDFERGIAARAGLSRELGAALLGLGLAAQWLGLILAACGRRAGLWATAAAAAVWVLGAVWDHGPELLARGLGFRDSGCSALWVLGLIATQGLAGLCALAALAAGPAARGIRR